LAAIGGRCTTLRVAEGVFSRVESSSNPILPSVLAVDCDVAINVFGLKVERRSMPHNYTERETPPFEV